MSSFFSSSSGSGSKDSKSKSGSASKSGSQDGSQYSSQSGSKSQSGSQFSSSRSKSHESSNKSGTASQVKSKEEVKQEKHIFDRIAAGENINGSAVEKNPPSSKAAQVKDGSQTHGHILKAGHYRLSPGFQHVRHSYQKKQEESGNKIDPDLSFLKAPSMKATSQAKKITSDEAIHKPLKSAEHGSSNKSSENPFFGTLSVKPKATSSDKSLKKIPSEENKSSLKQQQTSKSNDGAKSSDGKSHH